MKKTWICVTFILLFVTQTLRTAPTGKKDLRIKQQRANFKISMDYILAHEGYYVKDPDDKGGETYCGITRVYQPNWLGWKYIDRQKKYGKIKWNTHIADRMLDFYVQDYYLDLWVTEDFFSIKDQHIANYLFDFRVNGTIGTRIIQKALQDIGFKIEVTNEMDSTTIKYINKSNKASLLRVIKERRSNFYRSIALRDSSQRKFLNHWLYRANHN